MSLQINLSVIEENPSEVPEDIERLGRETLQILWQTSQDIAQQEIEAIKNRYQQYKAELMYQRQEALNKVEQVNGEIVQARGVIEALRRENKSLKVDLDRKISELKSAEDQVIILQEKHAQQEHENKHLTEEVGRFRENSDGLQKRLYEINRQAEQDSVALKEVREELIVNQHYRERLEKDLKTTKQETEEIWKQLKQEQRRAAIAEALVQEMRETTQKCENGIKQLKEEKQEVQSSLTTETKARTELEKKVAMLTARADAQEWGYKEMIAKLEHELELSKNDAYNVRNRMIKAEGALEREKKAIERLETKLVAATGAKL